MYIYKYIYINRCYIVHCDDEVDDDICKHTILFSIQFTYSGQ